jgi:hypothetical protein
MQQRFCERPKSPLVSADRGRARNPESRFCFFRRFLRLGAWLSTMRDEPRLIKLLRDYQVSLCHETMVLNLHKDSFMILYEVFLTLDIN